MLCPSYTVKTVVTGVFMVKEYIENLQHGSGMKTGSRKNKKKFQRSARPFWRKLFPGQEEGQSRDAYMRQNLALSAKYGALVIAALAVVRGGYTVISENVATSSSVNGRELPIYCVETDEKKIALSFDAAWGNEDTAKILEILAKQNVKVTFFMTGGWVLGWTYMKSEEINSGENFLPALIV